MRIALEVSGWKLSLLPVGKSTGRGRVRIIRHASLTLYERQLGSLDDRDSAVPLFAILRFVLRFRPRKLAPRNRLFPYDQVYRCTRALRGVPLEVRSGCQKHSVQH